MENQKRIVVPPGTYQRAFLDYPDNPETLPPTDDVNEKEWRRRMPFAQDLIGEVVVLEQEFVVQRAFITSTIARAFIELNAWTGNAISMREDDFARLIQE